MQTTFDGPYGAGTTGAARVPLDDTFVVMRTEDGGLELLAEDLTLRLSPDDVRTLLFYGSTVELDGPDGAIAAIGVEPRRYAVVMALEGRTFRAPRWAITAVAHGRLPSAYLRARTPPQTRPSASIYRIGQRRSADAPG
jgi:hypothetical protein